MKFELSHENIIINFVNCIKILGIFQETNFTFKKHCLYLRNSLAPTLNIRKYLTSKHCSIQTNVLLQTTRYLILSKIEHIFGWCATTHLKVINK